MLDKQDEFLLNKAIKHKTGGYIMLGYGNFRDSGSSGPRSGGFRSGGGFRPRRSFGGPREMTKIKCAECGKEDEVPFKPRDGTSVLCKDCYFKKKGITPRSNSFGEKPKKEEFSDEESEADAGELSEDSEDLNEEPKKAEEEEEETEKAA